MFETLYPTFWKTCHEPSQTLKLKTMDRLAEVNNVEFYCVAFFCCSIQTILFKRFNADIISKLSLNLELTAPEPSMIRF